jgi:hypothetical protein
MPIEDYDPHVLPDIDQAHILVVGVDSTQPLFDRHWGLTIDKTVMLDPSGLRALVKLWRQLQPHDEEMRCHIPVFGVRFFVQGVLHTQASICWQCNNIFLQVQGNRAHLTFDGAAPLSQELLRLFQTLSGEEIVS